MSALTEIILYLIQTVLSVYGSAVLLRFMLQCVGADFYNPISQFLVKITAPALNPLRKVVPGYLGLDLAGLLLAVLIHMLAIALSALLLKASVPSWLLLPIWGLVGVCASVLNIIFIAILASIIISWVAKGTVNSATRLLYQLTEPVMAPFRKLLPPLGGMDFSPVLLLISINVLQILLRHTALGLGLHPLLVLGI